MDVRAAATADATGTQASRLHECEARKSDDDSTMKTLTSPVGDVAGGTPAFQSVELCLRCLEGE